MSRFRAFLPPLALMMIAAAIVWPAIAFTTSAGTPAEYDQATFHLGVIQQFASQLPWPRLSDYNAATAPGYHLLLAIIVRTTAANTATLQWINSGFGLALVGVAAWVGARFTTPWRAAALALPFAVSNHVISSAIWIVTDDPAWLCVALALGALMTTPRRSSRGGWVGVAWATAAACIRQINVCLALPLLVSAALSTEHRRPKLRRAFLGVLIIGAPVAALAWLWGGLTPPAVRVRHTGSLGLAALPFTLACVGAFGLPFVALAAVRVDRQLRAVLLRAAAAGAMLTAVIPTSFDHEHGRWGGVLWAVVARTPAVGQRSALMVLLAAVGSAVLVWLWHAARERGRGDEATILVAALTALAVAQAANSMVLQRYFEPPVLLLLAWLAAMSGASPQKQRWIPLAVLAAALILVTLSSIYWRPLMLPRLYQR